MKRIACSLCNSTENAYEETNTYKLDLADCLFSKETFGICVVCADYIAMKDKNAVFIAMRYAIKNVFSFFTLTLTLTLLQFRKGKDSMEAEINAANQVRISHEVI